MKKIRVAIVGVGNCASAVIQGIHYYDSVDAHTIGLMHAMIGQYGPSDIEVVAAFDIDARKVGKDVSVAVFCDPNCCVHIVKEAPKSGVIVRMGSILDGFSSHMNEYPAPQTFKLSNEEEMCQEDIVSILKESETEIMLNYLPVGSQLATAFYAECALKAGLGFVNNIPVFIASDKIWADRFKKLGLPIIGDDIKSQIGATIVHRVLSDLFEKRGAKIDRTYQLNVGGNTDFLNMINRERLKSKKISKTEAVQSVFFNQLDDDKIHVGPSDYVPWLKDNKICFIRIDGRIFGNVPINLELRLSVEDSPNSAGVGIDAIRCCKLALDKGIGGVLQGPSAYYMKRPPVQFTDDKAYELTEAFISEHGKNDQPLQ
ncbi:MAG: inositol-3-phosphate synthase [Desulfomonilaceae bacterium]